METVLYICLVIIYLWLASPSKTKETAGNQPKKGFKLIEIPVVHLEYVPKATVKRTVKEMRLQVRDLGIKGSARMNKQQLEYILNT
jgi:hypothetical protein